MPIKASKKQYDSGTDSEEDSRQEQSTKETDDSDSEPEPSKEEKIPKMKPIPIPQFGTQVMLIPHSTPLPGPVSAETLVKGPPVKSDSDSQGICKGWEMGKNQAIAAVAKKVLYTVI